MATAYHMNNGVTLEDKDPVPAVGVTLTFVEEAGKPIKLGSRGYHAGTVPSAALIYARGHMIDEVDCQDIRATGSDGKLVCAERTVLDRADGTTLLYRFACDQALSVDHLWSPPTAVSDYLTTPASGTRETARALAAAAARTAWDNAMASSGATKDAFVASWRAAQAAEFAAAPVPERAARRAMQAAAQAAGTTIAAAQADFDSRVVALFA